MARRKYARKHPDVPATDPARAGSQRRSLWRAWQRALELTATLEAEQQMVLAIAVAHIFEAPLAVFHSQLRHYRATHAATSAPPRLRGMRSVAPPPAIDAPGHKILRKE